VIDLAFGHEREPRLPRPLQPLLRRRRLRTPAFIRKSGRAVSDDSVTDPQKTQTTLMSLLFEKKKSKTAHEN